MLDYAFSSTVVSELMLDTVKLLAYVDHLLILQSVLVSAKLRKSSWTVFIPSLVNSSIKKVLLTNETLLEAFSKGIWKFFFKYSL